MIEDFLERIERVKNNKLKKMWSSNEVVAISVRTRSEMGRVVKRLAELKLIKPDFQYNEMSFNFETYKDKTVLTSDGRVMSKDDLTTERVVSFEEIKEMSVKYDVMTKSDILTGNVVRLRNGLMMILFGNFFVSIQGDSIPLELYTENLEHQFKPGYNVQQVYDRNGVLIWTRKIEKRKE